jgi:hypothetical protein
MVGTRSAHRSFLPWFALAIGVGLWLRLDQFAAHGPALRKRFGPPSYEDQWLVVCRPPGKAESARDAAK